MLDYLQKKFIAHRDIKPSNIMIDYVTIRVDIGGKQAGIYRGMDDRVRVRVSNCRTEGSIFTSLDIPKHSVNMDFLVTGSITKLEVNGRLFEENSRGADQISVRPLSMNLSIYARSSGRKPEIFEFALGFDRSISL